MACMFNQVRHMAKKYFLVIWFLPASVGCIAQEGRMETDRPDQTESVVVTALHYVQAEFGVHIEKDNGLRTFLHPTTLLKYGLSKRFEFRMITEFVSVERPLALSGGTEMVSGLLPVQAGGKLALWEEKNFLPQTAILFHLAPPTLGSKTFHNDKWAPSFRISMQHTLSDNIGLGYNLGAEWDGYADMPYWIYTLAPGFNIGKDWYGYVELFGAIRRGEMPQHSFDGGLAVYVNDDLRLDISSGFGLSGAAQDWYGAVGFSFRFKTK